MVCYVVTRKRHWVERMDMSTISAHSMSHSHVEVSRDLVHLQDAPHHASTGLHPIFLHLVIILPALRRVLFDEPRVPATRCIGRNDVLAGVAADIGARGAKTIPASSIVVFLEKTRQNKLLPAKRSREPHSRASDSRQDLWPPCVMSRPSAAGQRHP